MAGRSMARHIKSTMMVMGGLCWLAFAGLICFVLFQYLADGAGLQLLGFFLPVTSTTVGIGLIHFLGFSAGALFCFAVGVGLCAYGFVSAGELENREMQSTH
jgi:hypothetical protein